MKRVHAPWFSPRRALAKVAAETREMHRLYPFTKTVSSAKNAQTKRRDAA